MKLTDLLNSYSHQGPFDRKCARAEMPDHPEAGEGISYCNAIACKRRMYGVDVCDLLGKITPEIVKMCHQGGYEDPHYPADSTVRHYDNKKGRE